MMTLTHKGYVGKITAIDYEDGTICGRVIGVRGVIGFEAASAQELPAAFQATIDDYLALCAERGVEPSKVYSGRFQFRAGPDLHRRIAEEAEARGVPINTFLRRSVAKLLDRPARKAPRSSQIDRDGASARPTRHPRRDEARATTPARVDADRVRLTKPERDAT